MSSYMFPKIKDVLPMTNGLFNHMDYTFEVDVTKVQLDYLLLAQIGQRNPAPVIDLLHEDPFDELTSEELTTLASLMLNYFKPKWDKLKEIYSYEYDPIHNYLDEWEDDMYANKSANSDVESTRTDIHNTTVTVNNTRTDALEESKTTDLDDNSTRTDDLQETNTGTQSNSGSSTDTSSVWGFNSSADVNSDKDVGSSSNTRTDNLTKANTGTVTTFANKSGSEVKSNTGTVTDAGTNATTGRETREYEEDVSSSENSSRDRSGRHFGNIGNLTSQQMIKEEIELWKWSYIQEILNDARNFLTLEVYL